MKWKLFRLIPVLFCVLFFSQSICSVNENNICAICLERLVADQEHGEVVCLSCDQEHHRFHRNCINDAFEADPQHKCPLCRAENVAILSKYFVIRCFQKINTHVATAREWAENKRQDIQQKLLAIPSIYGLWQARNAAFAGAASALVGVPYVQGTAASGIGGLLRLHTTIETTWYYSGAFTVGYVGALMYAAMLKYCAYRWTGLSADAVDCVPLCSVFGAAAFNLWYNS